MKQTIERALKVPVAGVRPVAGGDINQAYRVELATGARLFVKTRAGADPTMYAREAQGLAWLEEARALRIPRVIQATEELLALEWIDSAPPRRDYAVHLGHGLARLHRRGGPHFGLDQDNFIGSLPQENRPRDRFETFYAEQRLLPLVARARDGGLMTRRLALRFERLCSRLPDLVGPPEPPARLHGDLWSGNIITDEHGEPVLIDPAVYGGHREIDLAMLRLFGNPSPRLFEAYDELAPRGAGHEQRVALFQLYPLLVHLCLFGAGYLGQLTDALAHYE